MRHPLPDPERSALLVIDMQEYFRGIAAPIIERVSGLVEATRRAGVPVIFTQHGHEDPARDGGMLLEWWEDLIVKGTPEWRILAELSPAPEDAVVRKKRYSAFRGTGLDDRLRAMGVSELVISGVMTNLCCETTARDAFVRDYRVFFLEDGTATASRRLHEATLENLAFGFATLLGCDDLWTAPSEAPRRE